MPTDPYVATELDDSPRHKQNLPAGVAVPPAAAWVRHRPGEVGPNEPTGALFGRPGPNIGFALTLVERQQGSWQLGPHEHLEDAGAVVAEIAMKRAAGFGRAPVKHDVDVAVALFGYDRVDETWQPARARFVHGAEHDYATRRRLVDAVPDDLLRVAASDARQGATAWRAAMLEAALPE